MLLVLDWEIKPSNNQPVIMQVSSLSILPPEPDIGLRIFYVKTLWTSPVLPLRSLHHDEVLSLHEVRPIELRLLT